MNFDMNQAGETPRSLPRPQNPQFFPDEVSRPTSRGWGKPLQLPSHRPVPAPLPAAAQRLLPLLGRRTGCRPSAAR